MTADILMEGIYARRMAENPESGPELIVFITIGQQICVLMSSFLSGFVIDYMDDILNLSGAQWNLLICILPSIIVLIPIGFNYIGDPKVTKSEALENIQRIIKTQRHTIILSVVLGISSVLFGIVSIVSGNPSVTFGISLAILITSNILIYGYYKPIIGKIIIFLAISAITNLAITGPAHYFYTDPPESYPEGPHFPPWFLVTVCGIIGALGCIIGSIIFGRSKLKSYTIVYFCIFIINAIISTPNSILFSRLNLNWGVSDYIFVATDTAIQSAMNMLLFMPGFLLLSRICPERTEASTFAILASNTNFATNIALPISAFICSNFFGITPDGSVGESKKFQNMWIANLVFCAIKLSPITMIWLLPKIRMTDSIPEQTLCRRNFFC
jgi:hypothetical protein